MRMKQFLSRSLLALVAAVVLSPAASAQTTFVVTPTSAGWSAASVNGVPLDHAPGYKHGSLASNGVAKSDWYVTPEALFGGREIKISDVAAVSFLTKKGTDHVVDVADWYLNIYTKPFPGDVSAAAWYGSRIGAEPYFADNMLDTPGQWNLWTSETDGTNILKFFDSTLGYFGSYTDPTWDAFKANPAGVLPYASQTILYFSIQTGSATALGFTGQVDGLRIELTDGSVANINFEPFLVPSDAAACRKDGWKTLFRADQSAFTNQGECVSYVNTGR
jgi:hypothetical protein